MGESANRRYRHSPAQEREPGINASLALELFAGHDLDAEARQALVVMHRRRQIPDRGDAEIPEDLRADADFAPLLVAIGLRGLLLGQWRDRDAGRAVAQIHQDAAAVLLEMGEHGLHVFRSGENVPYDID